MFVSILFSVKKRLKKGAGYFFWQEEDYPYSWTVHTEKVACSIFS
jgi:hypothetical protein